MASPLAAFPPPASVSSAFPSSASDPPAVPSFIANLMAITVSHIPRLAFQNRSPDPICYKVELSSGNISTNAMCDYAPGIFVNATTNLTLYPSRNFNGAITAMTMNGTKGARHEFNYPNTTTEPQWKGRDTWYDIDYEMGMSNSTFGPADHSNRTNGLPSLAGEKNCLAKANAAWVKRENKSELLPHYYYLDHRLTGNLSVIRMDKKAPFAVEEFLQMHANLTGYVGHGSVDGVAVDPNSREGRAYAKQDRMSFHVATRQMEIIAY